ncbi:MAG TPA: hypothetical protein VIM42_05660 [Clostridium sp.]
MNKILSIPIENFTLSKFEQDDRIAKLEMKFMHAGENLNDSFIGLEVIQSAIANSLSNTPTGIPILASFNDDDSDFKSHDDDEISIGVIPPINNNISYKVDAINKKTYAFIDGYIWRYYSRNSVDILEESKDKTKSCSIEIEVMEGHKDKEKKTYIIESFRFLGVTLLGSSVSPGMEGANVKLDYNFNPKDNYVKQLKEISDELNLSFTKNDNSNKKDINTENFSEDINIKQETEKEDKFMKKNEIVKALKYSLTALDLYGVLNDALCQVTFVEDWCGENYECPKYSMDNFDNNFIYADDNELCIDVQIPFTMNGDNAVVDFDNATRIKYVPTAWDNGTVDDEEAMEGEFAKHTKENNKKFTEKLVEVEVSKAVLAKETELNEKFAKTLVDNTAEFEVKLIAKEVELNAKFEAIPVVEMPSEVVKTEAEPIIVENIEITALNEKFSALEKSVLDKDIELVALKEFKATTLHTEIQGKADVLFSKYAEYINEDEKKDLNSKLFELKFEDFEDKVKAIALPKVEAKLYALKQNSNLEDPNKINISLMGLPVDDNIKNNKTPKSSMELLDEYVNN